MSQLKLCFLLFFSIMVPCQIVFADSVVGEQKQRRTIEEAEALDWKYLDKKGLRDPRYDLQLVKAIKKVVSIKSSELSKGLEKRYQLLLVKALSFPSDEIRQMLFPLLSNLDLLAEAQSELASPRRFYGTERQALRYLDLVSRQVPKNMGVATDLTDFVFRAWRFPDILFNEDSKYLTSSSASASGSEPYSQYAEGYVQTLVHFLKSNPSLGEYVLLRLEKKGIPNHPYDLTTTEGWRGTYRLYEMDRYYDVYLLPALIDIITDIQPVTSDGRRRKKTLLENANMGFQMLISEASERERLKEKISKALMAMSSPANSFSCEAISGQLRRQPELRGVSLGN